MSIGPHDPNYSAQSPIQSEAQRAAASSRYMLEQLQNAYGKPTAPQITPPTKWADAEDAEIVEIDENSSQSNNCLIPKQLGAS